MSTSSNTQRDRPANSRNQISRDVWLAIAIWLSTVAGLSVVLATRACESGCVRHIANYRGAALVVVSRIGHRPEKRPASTHCNFFSSRASLRPGSGADLHLCVLGVVLEAPSTIIVV